MTLRRFVSVALAATALIAAGCGGSDKKSSDSSSTADTTARGYSDSGSAEAAAKAGAEKYYADLTSGDAAAACADMTAALQKKKAPCVQTTKEAIATGAYENGDIKVESAKVTGNQAVVTISANGYKKHVLMALEDGTWKFDVNPLD